MAECEMISIAGYLAGAASSKKHFDGAAVFAAEVVQVGDVVIGLIAPQRHSVAFTEIPRFSITIQRPWKIVQAYEADGHVMEGDGNAFPILILGESFIGDLVMRDGLLEAILAMKDVAYIVIEDADTPRLAKSSEDFARSLGGREGAVVFAKQNEWLDGAVQRAGCFLLISQCFIDFCGLFVMLDRGTVLATSIKSIRFGPQPFSQAFFSPQLSRDQQSGIRQVQCLACIHADFLEHQTGELRDDLRPGQ